MTGLFVTLRSFIWNKEAQAAFAHLKVLFTPTPVLSHPHPARQFVVEVAALDKRVRVLTVELRGWEVASVCLLQLTGS